MTEALQSTKLSSDTIAMMRYQAAAKSAVVAYLLWFFVGVFGGHRFYLGHIGTGILILICTLLGIFLTVPLIVTAIALLFDLFINRCNALIHLFSFQHV